MMWCVMELKLPYWTVHMLESISITVHQLKRLESFVVCVQLHSYIHCMCNMLLLGTFVCTLYVLLKESVMG